MARGRIGYIFEKPYAITRLEDQSAFLRCSLPTPMSAATIVHLGQRVVGPAFIGPDHVQALSAKDRLGYLTPRAMPQSAFKKYCSECPLETLEARSPLATERAAGY